jgi:hypothetical protein
MRRLVPLNPYVGRKIVPGFNLKRTKEGIDLAKDAPARNSKAETSEGNILPHS